MNESVNKKELIGISGWLVLFQIYIIIMVVGGVQILSTSLFNPLFMGATIAIPLYLIILQVADIALALVCMVLFYRRRKAFRPIFVGHSVLFVGESIFNRIEYGSVFDILSIVGLVIGIGVTVTFIIALYKSQRVTNTFTR